MKGTRIAGHQTCEDWCPFCFALIRTGKNKLEDTPVVNTTYERESLKTDFIGNMCQTHVNLKVRRV
jgi:hypothetical protein